MKEKSIYTTGEFAKRANVSVRTIRYYDEKGLLKPAVIKASGYRFYTDQDFMKLQQIIVLKRLGFSLDAILGISQNDGDTEFVKESFDLQLKLIHEKITELRQIEQAILEVSAGVLHKPEVEWNKIISLIHMISMEETLEKQYRNSNNVNARIGLHQRFSLNTRGWFSWIYDNLPIKEGMKILDTGCGNGQLWADNLELLPRKLEIVLSDISSGMLRSAREKLQDREEVFSCRCFDFSSIPFEDGSFDLVIANHVLFYAKDRDIALHELHRVLKKGGILCCSTYGRQHMKEIELLAKEFDNRIALSEVKLYDMFGLENGEGELSHYFSSVEILRYDDSLLVTEVQPLLDYIYSCHGNQCECLRGKQERFERYVRTKIGRRGLKITKDAGFFYCMK